MSKFALVPDGFTLKKVSKGEEDALKDHRRHEDVKAFLNNENTPILIGATGLIALTPILLQLFFNAADETPGVPTFTDEQKETIKKTYLLGIPGLGVSILAQDLAKDTYEKYFGNEK